MQCLLVIQLSHSAPRHFVQAQVCVCLDSVFCKNFWSFSFVSAHQAVVRHSVLACVFTFHFQALSLSRRLIFGFFRVWAQWKWQGLIWLSLKFYFLFLLYFSYLTTKEKLSGITVYSFVFWFPVSKERKRRWKRRREDHISTSVRSAAIDWRFLCQFCLFFSETIAKWIIIRTILCTLSGQRKPPTTAAPPAPGLVFVFSFDGCHPLRSALLFCLVSVIANDGVDKTDRLWCVCVSVFVETSVASSSLLVLNIFYHYYYSNATWVSIRLPTKWPRMAAFKEVRPTIRTSIISSTVTLTRLSIETGNK